MSFEYAYVKAGTDLAAVRVTAHRDGKVDSSFGRVEALGRLRVVVEEGPD